jgi:2-succinyl-6-hydroxy-2,4-cyclohexadiene-1-carboxylate synthase
MGEDLHYGMASVAQGLIQFLEALQMRHWGLVGYSMGGRLALYLALQFPAYFDRVILESASPGLQDQVARDRRFTHDLNLAQKLETSSLEDFTQFLRDWYNQPLFASLKNHPYFQAIFDRRLDNQPLELAKALRGLSVGVQPSLWDQLAKNQLPIVLLVGALDLKFVTIAQAMVESGQNLQLQIIQNCGHSIHLEKAELFAEQIRRFWV